MVNLQTAAEKQKTRMFHEEVRFLQKIMEKTAKTFKRKKLKFQVNKEVREFFDNLETIGVVDTEIIESSGSQTHLQSPMKEIRHDIHANDTQLNGEESHFDLGHKNMHLDDKGYNTDPNNKDKFLKGKDSELKMKTKDQQLNSKESDLVIENKHTHISESNSGRQKTNSKLNGNDAGINKQYLAFKQTEKHDPISSVCSRKEASTKEETTKEETKSTVMGRDGNKGNAATADNITSSITDAENYFPQTLKVNATETKTDIVLTEEDWIRYRETELNHVTVKPQSETYSSTTIVGTENENVVHKPDRRSVLQDLCKKLETHTRESSDKTVLGHRVEDGRDKAVNTEDQTTFYSTQRSCIPNWKPQIHDKNQDFSSNVDDYKASNKPKGIIKNWPNSKSSLRRSKSDSSKYSSLKSGLTIKEKDLTEKKTHHHVTFADTSVQNCDGNDDLCTPTLVSSEEKPHKTGFTNLKSAVAASGEQKPCNIEVIDVHKPDVVNCERHKTELSSLSKPVDVNGEHRQLKTDLSDLNRPLNVSGGHKSLKTELTGLNKSNTENNATADTVKNFANSNCTLRKSNSDSSKYSSLKIDSCSKENVITKGKMLKTFEPTSAQNHTKNIHGEQSMSVEVSGNKKPLSIPINSKCAESSSENLGTIKNLTGSKCDIRRTKSDAAKHSNLISGLVLHQKHGYERKAVPNEMFDATSDKNGANIMNDDRCNSNFEGVEENRPKYDVTVSYKKCKDNDVKLAPNTVKQLYETKPPEVGPYNTFPRKSMSRASYDFFNESTGQAASSNAVDLPDPVSDGADIDLTTVKSLDRNINEISIVRNTAGELKTDMRENASGNNIQESESDVTEDSIPESTDSFKSYPYLTNGFKVSNKRLAAYVRRRLHMKSGDYPDTIQSVLLKPGPEQYLHKDTTNVSQTFARTTQRNKSRHQRDAESVESAAPNTKPNSNKHGIQDIPRQAKSNRQRLPSCEEMLFDSRS